MALKITVIGTGYLGATHAAAMAELGFEVLGLDVVPEKIEMLKRGEVPLYEPGLEELLARHVDGIGGSSGRLRFTTDFAEAAAFGDVHFLCVNTPQKHGEYACDMSYVDSALASLAPHLTGPALVVGKSTVPVGSADRLAAYLAEHAPAGDGAELAWNPEFLREGFAVEDTLHPDRLVAGVRSERAEKLLREVYAKPIAEGTPFVVTDFPTAELVKTAANSFLATKISFINAMAEVCEAAGGDVAKLAEAIGYDDRIGRKFLRAGIGFGGGCLPKDIRAFMARAGELGADQALTFLREIDSINMRQRGQMVELTRQALGGGPFLGKRVAVLGATFKPDSDDVRDSPALNVAGQVHLQGAQVTVYDPKGMENARRLFPTLGYAGSALEAVRGADVVLHLTEWREFRELDPEALGEAAAARVILDGRNALDPVAWRKAGWTYRAMGRPTA
ncbi:UDP-glucose dehydrogenase family protein [Streptomyces olivaceus]|uniref:UDP-glucose 6-dehydrogenase n=1 Tax=Streptomyces olivaceus TaxID=47716 RepID=A0ABS7WBJ5_STROV|nr:MULTISPECIES: UDP-glucose/GDP-mannose dehydrogenase family protein [Streptomyces]AOW87354.1 UDP-glucose 6-dehydrogenase [Streptomyces olivaceus]MBZ6092594.1 UDP-glucose/GDP-mannose dehydrogenase family protein [Streptomyces olivaceus]MBZ6099468.1 UDP-glucose/GDP-mannose dehydrogenase family protein [Streptomyces olivaceus]MBZ6107531.1 UDP-glucose/GDP-mannose dehydrogenase family protein [Streptomyces olivaceus]MBZ6120438.1 UDP-glucose/GDP-mannose dehydrogenase family protein [Streptomyces o